MTGDLSQELCDLADLAQTCRRLGHSERAIACAAGLPPVVHTSHGMSVDEIVALTVHENSLTHPEDIAVAREEIERVARLLGVKPTTNASASTA